MRYVVVAALSFLGGFGLARWRRSRDVPVVSRAEAAPEVHAPVPALPVSDDAAPEANAPVPALPVSDDTAPAGEPTARDPRIDAAVAAEVLTVADRLNNAELSRRLRDALRRLPDLRVVDPALGSTFDPLVHEWAESRPTADPEAVDTVAEVLTPGFTGIDGRPLRLARVAVHDQIGD